MSTSFTRKNHAKFDCRHIGVALVAMLGIGGFAVADTQPAQAGGCGGPPCGALSNHTPYSIQVKWTDDDGKTWHYDLVQSNTMKGGWLNDGIDVDFWNIPAGCTDKKAAGPGYVTEKGPQWAKIWDHQTVIIKSRSCS